MKKILLILCLSLPLVGCSTVKTYTIESETEGTRDEVNDTSEVSAPETVESGAGTDLNSLNDRQKAYRQKLYEFMESDKFCEGSAFSLYDISADGIPELIISADNYHAAACEVYGFSDNDLVLIGRIGSNGIFAYQKDNNMSIDYFMGQGCEITVFCTIENNKFTELATFYNDEGRYFKSDAVTYKHNDNVVTADEYNTEIEKYNGNDIVTLGRDYTFDEIDKAIESEGTVPKIDLNSLNDRQKAYRQKLYEFMESDKFCKGSAFSLYDISADGIPELIISEDTSHAAACEVYSYDGGELISFGRMGAYGDIGYYNDNNTISQYNLGQGYEYDGYFRIENNELIRLAVFNNDKGAAEPGTAVFKYNDIELSEEEYNAELKNYQGIDYVSLGRDYKFYEIDKAVAKKG